MFVSFTYFETVPFATVYMSLQIILLYLFSVIIFGFDNIQQTVLTPNNINNNIDGVELSTNPASVNIDGAEWNVTFFSQESYDLSI